MASSETRRIRQPCKRMAEPRTLGNLTRGSTMHGLSDLTVCAELRVRRSSSPSVPMMLRQRPAGSLPLRAEVTASNGYAPFE
jgi:hypothetical protein